MPQFIPAQVDRKPRLPSCPEKQLSARLSHGASRFNGLLTSSTFHFAKNTCLLLAAIICLGLSPVTILVSDDGIEFFEKRIRPVLVEHCFDCHSGDARKLKGGLLLESREQLLKGGDSGPAIVPDQPIKSLLVQSLKWDSYEMPPKGKLPAKTIKDFEHWISIGAPWPQSDSTPLIAPDKSYDWPQLKQSHWAFQPIAQPELPVVKQNDWPRNEIDRFVLAKIEQNKLAPATSASPTELVRRIYFDLIGLPPTPQETDRFFKQYQQSADEAIRSLVDQLLERPEYGERWARYWLDVARYSDGFGGFNDNEALDDAWRYRDWVVKAFNDDKHFRDFIKLQIAGDLLEDKRSDVATGFLALGPTYKSDGGDPDSLAQAKSETLDDRVDTVTRGLLGITASCARCHDHKFDPIPQLDYYSLAGVFNNTATHRAPCATRQEVQDYHDHQKQIAEQAKKIQQLDQRLKMEKRNPTADEVQQKKNLQAELNRLKKASPTKYATAHALKDVGSENMKVAIRGNLRRTGKEAPRRFLRILAGTSPPLYKKGSGRLELANSIIAPDNPLTARVFVNRIWQHHFGKAIVRTPSNFGQLGESPTHPKLLDWLASSLLKHGSIKQIHRLIMNSSTYRMTSAYDEKAFAIDGDNRLLWRMNPRRLDVEAWRDALLAVTGELDLQRGGPPSDDPNMKRRTLYFKVSRGGDRFRSDELLRKFDFPLMRATVAKRPVSIVPQQYLFLLNSSLMADRSHALANRLVKVSDDDAARIRFAYRLLYARQPTAAELDLGIQYVSQKATGKVNQWDKYCQVLLSSNEFFYVP